MCHPVGSQQVGMILQNSDGDAQARSRIDSTGSAGSETGSGVHEPPSTPSGASLASIQAASTLYSSSLANRFNNGESAELPTWDLTAFQEQTAGRLPSAASILTA